MSQPFSVSRTRVETYTPPPKAEPEISNNEVHISVAAIPVGFNHYVKHTRNGRHYVTPEAKAFKQLVALAFRQSGQKCVANKFGVGITLWLGEKQKLDVDGAPKIVLDALQEIGAFENPKGEKLSDSHVTGLFVIKKRAPDGNPKTEIQICEGK